MLNDKTPSPGGSKPQRPPLNLAERRAKTGISLKEIAESTRISIRFLEAIEREDFDVVPGGIFLRSYLKQYAAAIGCNAGELLEAAGCTPGAAQPGEAELPKWPKAPRVSLRKMENIP